MVERLTFTLMMITQDAKSGRFPIFQKLMICITFPFLGELAEASEDNSSLVQHVMVERLTFTLTMITRDAKSGRLPRFQKLMIYITFLSLGELAEASEDNSSLVQQVMVERLTFTLMMITQDAKSGRLPRFQKLMIYITFPSLEELAEALEDNSSLVQQA